MRVSQVVTQTLLVFGCIKLVFLKKCYPYFKISNTNIVFILFFYTILLIPYIYDSIFQEVAVITNRWWLLFFIY